jgi:hypothetical protein
VTGDVHGRRRPQGGHHRARGRGGPDEGLDAEPRTDVHRLGLRVPKVTGRVADHHGAVAGAVPIPPEQAARHAE